MALVHFLAWTLILYWIHRLAHCVPGLCDVHWGHHKFIAINPPPGWHWTNLLLYQDNPISTLDVWLTEVIPTILFCWITGAWWIAIAFYLWSALVQEAIEHNPRFNYFPWLTSGQWHLIHHNRGKFNFGIFITVWDKMFGTFCSVQTRQ